MRKNIYSACFLGLVTFYGHLLFENHAFNFFGEKVGNYAERCWYIDAYAKTHKFVQYNQKRTSLITDCSFYKYLGSGNQTG